jgi:hypothetical protein
MPRVTRICDFHIPEMSNQLDTCHCLIVPRVLADVVCHCVLLESMVLILPLIDDCDQNHDFVCRAFGRESTLTLPTFDILKQCLIDQWSTIIYDSTTQIILGFHISPSWRTTHLPFSTFNFLKPTPDQWTTSLCDPTVQILSGLHVS